MAPTHIPARMITNAKFVEIWQTSDSIDDVVKTTGMKKGTILGRANRLKKGGVELKKAGRTRVPRKGRAPVDYSELKELAVSLAPK